MFVLTLFFFCACYLSEGTQGNSSQAALLDSKPILPSNFDLKMIDGSALQPEIVQGKVVLYVNVASKCGFTGQYEQLQKIHSTYQSKGFTVVGVPCNQFGGQEPGSASEIVTFCQKNYGVDFPLLEKQDVKGKNQSALYASLVNSPAGKQKNIRWNFEKFLVAADGQVLQRFPSSTAPDDPKLIQAIEMELVKSQ